jgi:hypothetical protein
MSRDDAKGAEENKDDGRHSVGDDKETGKQPDDFDLREYGER